MDDRNLIFFLIDSLAEYEGRLKQLYATFAKMFTASSDLWDWLSEEESHHEEWINVAKDIIGNYKICLDTGTYDVKSLENAIKDITCNQERAAKGEINEAQALKLAFDIENSILENNVLGVLNCENQEVSEYYKDLMRETQAHRQVVLDRMKEMGIGAI